MPSSISSFFARNTLKRDVCEWDHFNLIKLHELMADDKMKEGAVLYVNTTRPWFGKTESFVSTRAKTTSHGLSTPEGSKDKAAERLLETLNQKFVAGRHYTPEAQDARDYLVLALTQKMEVVKDARFLQAMHTVAHAKEIVPEPQQDANDSKLGLQDRLDRVRQLAPGMSPDVPSDWAIATINAQPDAVKQTIRTLLQPTLAKNYEIDTATRQWVIDVLIGLDTPPAAESAPSVGDTSQAIGSFAHQLQHAAQAQLGHAEFAEIDEQTTLGELLDNINSRSVERKHAIKQCLRDIIGVVPEKGPTKWPQLYGHAHMAARVAAGIEASAPADPYADIADADLYDFAAAARQLPPLPAIAPAQTGTETTTYSSSDSEEYVGSLNLSNL